MAKLFFILLLAPWAYAIGIAMYFLILRSHKKRLPATLVIADLIFIGLFLYVHNLVYERKLIFFKTRDEPLQEFDLYAEIGITNTTLVNLAIDVIAFFVIQLLFMKYVIMKRIDKLNDPPPAKYWKNDNSFN